jgi:GNAT superfamily N-acetyltransferase
MLDKSIPYADFAMRRRAGAPLPDDVLPPGFSLAMYEPGSEKDWARIETSVLEFTCEMDALLYFQKFFLPYGLDLPYGSELQMRCMFLETNAGEKVATATAWWGYTGIRRDPMLHWVAVKPAYQGKGLGKAMIACAVRHMANIEGDRDFYLHTQTWSHVAVRLYERAHFHITDEPNPQGKDNSHTVEAVKILADIGYNTVVK